MTKYFKRERIKGYWYYIDTPVNAIEIPDNATNGEVVELMFPESKVAANTDKWGNAIVTVGIRNGRGFYFTLKFDWKWWHSPYKRGETE